MGNQFPNQNNANGFTGVHHDETLTGTGVDADNPLKVAKPAAETGAQKNIPRLQKFAAQDTDTRTGILRNGGFGLKLAGNNVYQANQSLSAVEVIDLPFKTAAFGTDPTLPNTNLTAVDTKSFFDLFLNADSDNNIPAGVLAGQPLFLTVHNADVNKTAYVRVGTITKDVTNRKYVCTDLTWGDPAFQPDSAGEHYDMTAYMSIRTMAAGIVGLAAKYVALASLKPRDEDIYVAYSDGVIGQGGTDKTNSIVVTSDQSGAPQNANAYRRFNNVPNNVTVSVWMSTRVWNGDPNSPGLSERTITADDIGDTLYMSFLGKPGNHIKFNVVSESVTVTGSGGLQHVYFQATTEITGTLQQQIEDVIKVTSEVPNAFWGGTEIPVEVIAGLDFVRQDGNNVTSELINAIQGDNEAVTLANQFNYNTAAGNPGTRYVQRTTSGNLNVLYINIPDTDTQADADLKRLLKLHAWVQIGNHYTLDITSNASRSVAAGNITYSFNFVVERNSGAEPTLNTAQDVTVVGSDVHRGELDAIAFNEIAEMLTLTVAASDDWLFVHDLTDGKIKKIAKSDLLTNALLGGGTERSYDTNEWVDYEPYDNDTLLLVGYGTSGVILKMDLILRFGDLSSAYDVLTTNWQIRRNSGKLQVKRTAGSDTLKMRVIRLGTASS